MGFLVVFFFPLEAFFLLLGLVEDFFGRGFLVVFFFFVVDFFFFVVAFFFCVGFFFLLLVDFFLVAFPFPVFLAALRGFLEPPALAALDRVTILRGRDTDFDLPIGEILR